MTDLHHLKFGFCGLKLKVLREKWKFQVLRGEFQVLWPQLHASQGAIAGISIEVFVFRNSLRLLGTDRNVTNENVRSCGSSSDLCIVTHKFVESCGHTASQTSLAENRSPNVQAENCCHHRCHTRFPFWAEASPVDLRTGSTAGTTRCRTARPEGGRSAILQRKGNQPLGAERGSEGHRLAAENRPVRRLHRRYARVQPFHACLAEERVRSGLQ